MGCGIAIVKYLVFIFNLIFAIIGLSLLVVGVLFQVDIKVLTDYNSPTTESLGLAPICLIVIGSLIFLISFFGCCGAIKESNCMLVTYAIALIIILIAQIAIAILSFVLVKDTSFKEHLQADIQEEFKNYNSTVEAKTYFNNLQENLKCCGVHGPQDWKYTIPPSCCMDQTSQDSCRINDPNIYHIGCADKAEQKISLVIRSVGYVALAIGVVEFLGVFFAFCLTNSMRNQYRRGTYA